MRWFIVSALFLLSFSFNLNALYANNNPDKKDRVGPHSERATVAKAPLIWKCDTSTLAPPRMAAAPATLPAATNTPTMQAGRLVPRLHIRVMLLTAAQLRNARVPPRFWRKSARKFRIR